MSEYRDASAALRAKMDELGAELARARARHAELEVELSDLVGQNDELAGELVELERDAKQAKTVRLLSVLLFAPLGAGLGFAGTAVLLLLSSFLVTQNPPLSLVVAPAYLVGLFAGWRTARKTWQDGSP